MPMQHLAMFAPSPANTMQGRAGAIAGALGALALWWRYRPPRRERPKPRLLETTASRQRRRLRTRAPRAATAARGRQCRR
jgi:membrane associated rhomboid family serine protease